MKKFYYLIEIMLLLLFFFFLILFALKGFEYYQAAHLYEDIATVAFLKPEVESAMSFSTLISNETVSDETPLTHDESLIDWENLESINPDIIAWIYIPNTPICYPVVKSADNAEYLSLTVTREKNSAGSIFLDCYNSADFSDKNSIIYGHNMRSGTMFRALNKYSDKAFFESHPCVYLFTKEGMACYNIIAVLMTDTSSLVFQNNPSDYPAWLSSVQSASVYDTKVSASPLKNTISLTTCRGAAHSQNRTVIILQEQ